MINTEVRISNLENENKARKALYPVAGSLVRFVSQTSQVFTKVAGSSELVVVRVKFTPDIISQTGRSIVELNPQVSVYNNFSSTMPRVMYVNEPQTGDGSIIIKLTFQAPAGSTTYYIRVIASGSSLGTFQLIS